MAKLAHSFSSLKMYENCPKRYYHQRITKEVRDTGGEASIYGERIHKHMELRLRDKTPLVEEAASYERVCQSIENSAQGCELAVEQEMTLNSDLAPTGWWDADAWLRSKLDVLVVNKDKAKVIDWKTGKRRPDPTQLEMFALQVFAHRPEVHRVTASFVWLKTMQIDTQTYERGKAHELWADLLPRLDLIEKSNAKVAWPARPSGLCPYCPCVTFCEYARVR